MTEKRGKNKENMEQKPTWVTKFLSIFRRDGNVKNAKMKKHSKLFALVAIQYRDKIDTTWTYSIKSIIRKIVSFILKFAILFVLVFFILKLVVLLFVVFNEILNLLLIFLGIYLILNFISITLGLVKSLYLAEDNKVLATLPTTSTKLFISKILVFELFELKKSFDILLPVALGFIFYCCYSGVLPMIALFWSILPLFLIITVTVLLGALCSIPALYIYKFIKRNQVIEVVLLLLIAGLIVASLLYIVYFIPRGEGSININNSLGAIKLIFHNIAMFFGRVLYPIGFVFKALAGEPGTGIINVFKPITYLRTLILIGVAGALFGLVYLIIKPFYFSMMTKSFEFDKHKTNTKKDKKREKHWAFVVKEFKLTFRNFDISASYLGVYIIAPILLLLIDKTFAGMATNLQGDVMVSAFNIALISIPILASSTVISTVYSREGRTAYFKKTKPIKPYFPLTAKFLFNLIFSIPSIFASCWIYVKYTNASVGMGVLVGIIVLMLEYGHIFFSASLDIMNPQNELYATEGSSISNTNERISSAVGLIISLLMGVFAYLFCIEVVAIVAYIKILVISIVFAASSILLFYLKVKAFYIDRQEESR